MDLAMIGHRRLLGWVCLAAMATVVSAGCRDREATPSHYRDLGEGGAALLPPGSQWHNPAVKNGSADWVPFRQPGSDEEPSSVDKGTESAEARNAGIETDIRNLIEEYNEVASAGDFEELLLYHLESQQETIKPLFDMTGKVVEKLGALHTALDAQLPDEQDRIEAAFSLLKEGSSSALVIETLVVVSDAEVTGKLPAGSPAPACRFVLVDDEWFVEMLDLPDVSTLQPASDLIQTAFDGLIQGLSAQQMPPALVLQQIETMAQAVNAARQPRGAAAAEPGSQDEEQEPEKDQSEDDQSEEGESEDGESEDATAEPGGD